MNKIRALTRGEIKEIKKLGLDPLGDMTPIKNEELMNYILDKLFTDEDIDNWSMPKCLQTFRKILDLTYSTEEEEKN